MNNTTYEASKLINKYDNTTGNTLVTDLLNQSRQYGIKTLADFYTQLSEQKLNINVGLSLKNLYLKQLSKYRNTLIKFTSSSIVSEYAMNALSNNTTQEELHVLYLDNKLQLIQDIEVSKGTIDRSFIDSRMILKLALKNNAKSFILMHNHPSGDTTPSPQDLEITQKLYNLAKMFDIQLLDHFIVSQYDYYSMAENNDI